MTPVNSLRIAASFLLLMLLHGCALQQHQLTGMGRYLDSHSLNETLLKLDALKPEPRDRPLYQLNRGVIHHLLGNYQQSNRDFEAAKALLGKAQAISVTESITSTTINETFNDYSATPSERVLLHVVMALNYLAQKDLSSARVEALQADILMREIPEENAQLASARFIAGLIFELNGEWSDAMISYRKAEEILTRRHMPLPASLQQRLLISTRQLGLENEHQQYLSRFGLASGSGSEQPHTGEVLILFLNGKVPSKHQRMISIYVPALEHHVTIAQPYYPPRQARNNATALHLGSASVSLELLEDIDHLAREALEAGSSKRLALTLARATSKHKMIKQTRQKDPLLALLTDLAAIVTEVADTRSWNLLPASIHIGSVRLPEGTYPQRSPSSLPQSMVSPELQVKAGKTQLLITNSYNQSTSLAYY